MKTSNNNLMVILAISAAVLTASSVHAGGGFSFSGGGGGGGGGNSGGSNKGNFKFNFNNGSSNHSNYNNSSYKKSCHDNYKYYPKYHVHYVEPVRIVYSQCYHPQFCACYVFPGDTWYSISKRIYGVDFLCKHIASYNQLSMSSPLVPGQMLRLPVVNANGSLATSNAPMPAAFAPQGIPFSAQAVAPMSPQAAMIGTPSAPIAPQVFPNGLEATIGAQGLPNGSPIGNMALQGLPTGPGANTIAPQAPSIPPLETTFKAAAIEPTANATPAANIRTVTSEPSLPRVATGSTLVLDGTSLGEEKGIVRLHMGTLTLPVEVIEWTTSSVKIALPAMELGRPVKASLEVLRADGSLASKSGIELTPAATRVALGN